MGQIHRVESQTSHASTTSHAVKMAIAVARNARCWLVAGGVSVRSHVDGVEAWTFRVGDAGMLVRSELRLRCFLRFVDTDGTGWGGRNEGSKGRRWVGF